MSTPWTRVSSIDRVTTVRRFHVSVLTAGWGDQGIVGSLVRDTGTQSFHRAEPPLPITRIVDSSPSVFV